MKRESGYYWVKRQERAFGNTQWEVGFYCKESPFMRGFGAWIFEGVPKLADHHMVEINETRIKNPDEK